VRRESGGSPFEVLFVENGPFVTFPPVKGFADFFTVGIRTGVRRLRPLTTVRPAVLIFGGEGDFIATACLHVPDILSELAFSLLFLHIFV